MSTNIKMKVYAYIAYIWEYGNVIEKKSFYSFFCNLIWSTVLNKNNLKTNHAITFKKCDYFLGLQLLSKIFDDYD